MPSNKRAGEDVDGTPANVTAAAAAADGNGCFTGGVKKKIAGGRTGQACDRCKVRSALQSPVGLGCEG